MHTEATIENHYIRAAVLFVACLLLVFLFPLIGMFLNSSFLFFIPQYLFPYGGLVVREAYSSQAVFSHQVGLLLTFLHWIFVTAGFALVARRLSIVQTILAATALIVVVGIITIFGFSMFGVSVELDGP